MGAGMPDSDPASPHKAPGQGIVRDDRGQSVPADKARAQQSSSRRQRGESDPPLRRDDADPARKK